MASSITLVATIECTDAAAADAVLGALSTDVGSLGAALGVTLLAAPATLTSASRPTTVDIPPEVREQTRPQEKRAHHRSASRRRTPTYPTRARAPHPCARTPP
eukprot:1365124-Prymnesium_polylepis.1